VPAAATKATSATTAEAMAASATEAAAAAATGEPSHDAASEARVHMRNGLHLPTWRRREAPCRSSSR
jgi:hypothetical protein